MRQRPPPHSAPLTYVLYRASGSAELSHRRVFFFLPSAHGSRGLPSLRCLSALTNATNASSSSSSSLSISHLTKAFWAACGISCFVHSGPYASCRPCEVPSRARPQQTAHGAKRALPAILTQSSKHVYRRQCVAAPRRAIVHRMRVANLRVSGDRSTTAKKAARCWTGTRACTNACRSHGVTRTMEALRAVVSCCLRPYLFNGSTRKSL